MPDMPVSLASGLRMASLVPGCTVLESPTWDEHVERWTLELLISIERNRVTHESKWIVLVDDAYPLGAIDVLPAVDGGMGGTRWHQKLNRTLRGRRWSNGRLCLVDWWQAAQRRSASNAEPFTDPDLRLGWHLERARSWVESAVDGTLILPGDPFELPDIPHSNAITVVHDESDATLVGWSLLERSMGRMRGFRGPSQQSTLFVSEFLTWEGALVRKAPWSPMQGDGTWAGVWWLWPSPAVLPPWQAPTTWRELKQAATMQGVSVGPVYDALRACPPRERRILLLGYPMPRVWRGANVEVHWCAIQMPQKLYFRGPIDYVDVSNRHRERLVARSGLSAALRSRAVAIIGCAALGSTIAELLVRQGINRFVLFDGEAFEAGNLARHILDLSHIDSNKAEAVARRLRSISPTVHVLPIGEALAMTHADVLSQCDVVVDCTGEDDVVALLSRIQLPSPRWFVSASVDYGAERTFVYIERGVALSHEIMQTKLTPHIGAKRFGGDIVEGTGCWRPTFPGSLAAIWIAASSSLHALEHAMAQQDRWPSLHVYSNTPQWQA